MSTRTLVAAAWFAAATHAPVLAQQRVPQSLQAYRPHEIVEAVISEAGPTGLTAAQVKRLDDLHVAVRDERHRWEPIPGTKAHQALRMRPMISQARAYGDALAVLTPGQRAQAERKLQQPGFVPVVPSLATTVPPSLNGLAPHAIVEVFLAERDGLGLTARQVRDLGALHVAVRDEQHRYTRRSHGSKGPEHLMMEPMITKRRAYNDALSYLTSDQRELAARRFRDPAYRPSQKIAAN